MPRTVDRVRRAVPDECQVTMCRKEGCTLKLSGALSPYVLIDMDRCPTLVGQNQSKCDYIFVGHSNAAWVAVMELKRGKPKASELVAQIRAGVRIAERIVPADSQVRFVPIAVYGGGLRRIERDRLLSGRNRITFRGESRPIKLVRCGTTLAAALQSFDSSS